MQNALEKRLAALEAAKATSRLGEGGLHDIQRLMIALISYHLGGMQEGEPMAQATSRALDYGRSQDLSAGLLAEGNTSTSLAFDERYRGAVERLLALRGTGFEDSGNGVACALRSLFYAMPERIQRHRFLEGIDPIEMFEGIPEDATSGKAPCPVPAGPYDPNLQVATHLYQASLIVSDEEAKASRAGSDGKTARQAAAEYDAVLRGEASPDSRA